MRRSTKLGCHTSLFTLRPWLTRKENPPLINCTALSRVIRAGVIITWKWSGITTNSCRRYFLSPVWWSKTRMNSGQSFRPEKDSCGQKHWLSQNRRSRSSDLDEERSKPAPQRLKPFFQQLRHRHKCLLHPVGPKEKSSSKAKWQLTPRTNRHQTHFSGLSWHERLA